MARSIAIVLLLTLVLAPVAAADTPHRGAVSSWFDSVWSHFEWLTSWFHGASASEQRVAQQKSGAYIIPNGVEVTTNDSGAMIVPSGAQVTTEKSGALLIPNGLQYGPQESGAMIIVNGAEIVPDP